jgi:hypothetical protein
MPSVVWKLLMSEDDDDDYDDDDDDDDDDKPVCPRLWATSQAAEMCSHQSRTSFIEAYARFATRLWAPSSGSLEKDQSNGTARFGVPYSSGI